MTSHVCPSPEWGRNDTRKIPRMGEAKPALPTFTSDKTTNPSFMTTTTQMADRKIPGTVLPKEGWTERQQDTGWGWAAAHLLPFAGLIYAYQRRTITPLLHVVGGSFLIAFAVGFYSGLKDFNMSEEALDTTSTLASLVATPFLAKAGIDKARKFAAAKLEEDA